MPDTPPANSGPQLPAYWNRLLNSAQKIVRETIAELPPEFRELAEKIPVLYEPRPSAELIADGMDVDTLGIFFGEPYLESADTTGLDYPPEIVLYLDNLWDFADRDEEIFEEEVRITILHELGHYLGWDEDDIEERGLE